MLTKNKRLKALTNITTVFDGGFSQVNELIRMSAPSIYAESPVDSVTEKYTFIPTSKIIEDLDKLNFHVDRASQQKSKVDPLHVKHMVIFRSTYYNAVEGLMPEIILVNSHNKTTSFKFMIGLFRFACLNGLITGKTYSNLNVRHMGYKFEDINQLVKSMVSDFPKIFDSISRMSGRIMNDDEMFQFAIDAVKTRFVKEFEGDNEKLLLKSVPVNELLKPIRSEDEINNVWNVFNRLQERLMKGGWKRIGLKDDVAKSVREVKNINLNISINQGLWNMAEDFVK